MFIRRVKIQIKQLEVFTASLKKRKQPDFHGTQQKDQSNDLTRDQFGLHKIIVAVTESGKLFGLDTSSKQKHLMLSIFYCLVCFGVQVCSLHWGKAITGASGFGLAKLSLRVRRVASSL